MHHARACISFAEKDTERETGTGKMCSMHDARPTFTRVSVNLIAASRAAPPLRSSSRRENLDLYNAYIIFHVYICATRQYRDDPQRGTKRVTMWVPEAMQIRAMT